MNLSKLRRYSKRLHHAYMQWWRGSSVDMTWPWHADARNKAFVVATKPASLPSQTPTSTSVLDQVPSLRRRHALIHLFMHTLIHIPLRIACLNFARAEMPSLSPPHWRWCEQERHDGLHHPLPPCIAHPTHRYSPQAQLVAGGRQPSTLNLNMIDRSQIQSATVSAPPEVRIIRPTVPPPVASSRTRMHITDRRQVVCMHLILRSVFKRLGSQ